MDQFCFQASSTLCIIWTKATSCALDESHVSIHQTALELARCLYLSCMFALSLSNHTAGSYMAFNGEGWKRLMSPLRVWFSLENPRDKTWWKGSEHSWENRAVILHGECQMGEYVLATRYMKGSNMQLCSSLGQMRIADDRNSIFLGVKLVPGCWVNVRRQSLDWVSILWISCFLSKFSSVCHVWKRSIWNPTKRKSSFTTWWSPSGVPVELAWRLFSHFWPHNPSTGAGQKSIWPLFSS